LLHSGESNETTGALRAKLSLEPAKGVRWFADSDGSTRAGCLLPANPGRRRSVLYGGRYSTRHRGRSGPDDDVVDGLLEVRAWGIPIPRTALVYAALQADDFMRFGELDAEQQSRLQLVQQRLQEAARFATASGVFSAFAGGIGVQSPGIATSMEEVHAREPVIA